MTRFRPCIDLHQGRVAQIVGGTLRDSGPGPVTNHVAREDGPWFARRYQADGALGGHVIMLGAGNEAAARSTLAAWQDGLHIGGGISLDNARGWIDAGAAKVIVTSWLFPGDRFDPARLAALSRAIGRERIVVDLSCRRRGGGWNVATRRWQTVTDQALGQEFIASLASDCSELLVHAADVEGLCQGIDAELVAALAQWSDLPCTYAGGGRDIADLAEVERLSGGALDLTFGSALDLFGGSGVRYADCLAWNRLHPWDRSGH